MYEWDEDKRRKNLAKHGIDLAAVRNFDWSTAAFLRTEIVDFEERQIVVGLIFDTPYLLVYSERDDSCRVISLRRATRQETERWLAGLT